MLTEKQKLFIIGGQVKELKKGLKMEYGNKGMIFDITCGLFGRDYKRTGEYNYQTCVYEVSGLPFLNSLIMDILRDSGYKIEKIVLQSDEPYQPYGFCPL